MVRIHWDFGYWRLFTDDVRVSVVISLQNWLAETPEEKKTSATPAYMNVFMSGTFPHQHSEFSIWLRRALTVAWFYSHGTGGCMCVPESLDDQSAR